jgi:hypothetical protein
MTQGFALVALTTVNDVGGTAVLLIIITAPWLLIRDMNTSSYLG